MTDLLLASPPAAVTALLPDIDQHRLTADQAFDRIAANPTLVPLAIDAERVPGGVVYWADLSGRGQDEWQLVYDLEAAVRAGTVGDRFVTSLAILDRDPPPDSRNPTGFVFHMSRCGSTLVSRSLAQSPRHLVRSQPGPLRDGIWTALTANWTTMPTTVDGSESTTDTLRPLRNLIGYLLRTDRGPVDGSFLKFYSENVLFLPAVRAAFPDVPCLFLFRDPAQVLASVNRNGTGMLAARGTQRACLTSGLTASAEAAADDLDYLASCFSRYLQTVLDVMEKAGGRSDSPAPVTALEHRHLTAEHFPAIVADAFGHDLPSGDVDAILGQFNWHAKSPSGSPAPYRDDSEAKRAALSATDRRRVDERLGPLLARLRAVAWCPSTATTDGSDQG